MIRIRVSTEDVVATRFAVNAVWESATSLHCLAQPRQHVVHARLHQCVPTHPDFDFELLLELVSLTGWMPDLLSPIPTGTPYDPPAQFAALVGTDLAVAERDLRTIGMLAPGSRAASMTPAQYVETTTAAVAGYWRAVLEPLWERILGIDEADVAHHHVTLAEAGSRRPSTSCTMSSGTRTA